MAFTNEFEEFDLDTPTQSPAQSINSTPVSPAQSINSTPSSPAWSDYDRKQPLPGLLLETVFEQQLTPEQENKIINEAISLVQNEVCIEKALSAIRTRKNDALDNKQLLML